MKFVVTWDNRWGGNSAADIDENGKRLLDAFGKWAPPTGLNIITMLERLDSKGGYAIIEADNAADIADISARFGAWLDFTVITVMDLVESIGITQQGMDYRSGI